MQNRFNDIFEQQPIIGMIHLAGKTREEKIERALDEIAVFEQHGIEGAIIENYHGRIKDVVDALKIVSDYKTSVRIGLNILPKELPLNQSVELSFQLAKNYDAAFIQLDHVAGRYVEGALDKDFLKSLRKDHPSIAVLGGIWPKYYTPIPGSDLESDLKAGMDLADAIVVTGEGTGIETPIEKIAMFRKAIGEYPLISGAGTNHHNVCEQLRYCDGTIVGSGIKVNSNTRDILDFIKVNVYMNEVSRARWERKKKIQRC